MLKRYIGVLLALVVLAAPASVGATSYDVTASVMAPLPPTTPVVTSPGNYSTQQNDSVYISGTCTIVVPNLIVVLERDGQTVGTGNCSAEGTFRILVGLVLGANVFYPKFVTITGQFSGYGAPVTLNYENASQHSNTDKTTDSEKNASEALRVTMPYDFITYNDTEVTSLIYTIFGGIAPYKVTISWGDDTQRVFSQSDSGENSVKHQYRSILPPSTVSIRVVDAKDNNAIVTRALVSFRQGTYIPPAQPLQNNTKQWFGVWLIGAGCISGVVLLMYTLHKETFFRHSKNTQKIKKQPKKVTKGRKK